MSRLRFVFEKRQFSCFVRHVELPPLFGRIARRAGLSVELTQGMSPHPHIVMGPALPVGVVSLYELADVWFTGSVEPADAVERLNAQSPEGFRFLKAAVVPSDSASLNKCFDAATYWLSLRQTQKLPAAARIFREKLPETVLSLRASADEMELVMGNPSALGPGALVKALTAAELISGWPEVCIARLVIGRWNKAARQVTPLL